MSLTVFRLIVRHQLTKPLKPWTGHDEQHGIEVRILNDGDS